MFRLLLLLQDSPQIFASTSESSCVQTTELIMKCHTILEMGSHDLLDLNYNFGKGPKREVIIGYTKN